MSSVTGPLRPLILTVAHIYSILQYIRRGGAVYLRFRGQDTYTCICIYTLLHIYIYTHIYTCVVCIHVYMYVSLLEKREVDLWHR